MDAKTPLSETPAVPVAAQWGRVCPLLPLTAERSPSSSPVPPPTAVEVSPQSDSRFNSWQVKAAARAEGGAVTLEMVVLPASLGTLSLPPEPAPPLAPSPPPEPTPPAAVEPAPPTPEAVWEETPEQAAEQLTPPLPPPETVETVRVTPLRRFFGNVPIWQWGLWLGLMALAVGGGFRAGTWAIRQLPSFQTDNPTPPPAAPPALLALTTARPLTIWQMGEGRLAVYQVEQSYATAHLAILTGRTRAAAAAQRLLEKRWFGSGRFEPEGDRTRRLPLALCGQFLDTTREEGLYRLDTRTVPATRDRLILRRGHRQQAVVVVAYGRNPPRLADELLKSLACR